jgi:c-di-AMP phosphodiesterase-like protein
MSRSPILALAVLLLVVTTEPLVAEIFQVVRITDLSGNANFQICTEEEKRTIEAELKEEARGLPKVIEAAKTEWNLTHSEASFPTTRINARTLKVMNTAIDREEAGKLLAQAKIREERSLAKEESSEERILSAKSVARGRAHRAAVAEKKSQVREERKQDEIAERAEAVVRQKLAAAVGHAVPFYGAAPEEPKKAERKKKN